MRQKIILYLVLIASYSCNQQGDKPPNRNFFNPMPDTDKNNSPGVLRLIKHELVDKEATGMVASTYLIPSDWRVDDNLYWEYRDATVPIRYKGIMQNNDGTMAIQTFADVRANWATGPSGTSGYRPPADIISGMKDLINQERKGKNINYVDQKILSSNQQPNNQQGSQLNQTGVIHIEYVENGQAYEEEFYGQLDVSDAITPSVMGNMEGIIWAASNLYACKALKGNLDNCRKIAQTIKSSVRLTLPFYNRLAQVIQLLSDQVYAQIYQAGQISKIISATNDQMIANIDASYRQ
ncbi:MAG: hypothetical protein ABIQ07_05040, partial [Ginsengibacter sp.]